MERWFTRRASVGTRHSHATSSSDRVLLSTTMRRFNKFITFKRLLLAFVAAYTLFFLYFSPISKIEDSLDRKSVEILLWFEASPGWWNPWNDINKCPLPCTVTTDRSHITTAPVVVFHAAFSTIGQEFPQGQRNGSQLWVLYDMESPENTPAYQNVDFMKEINWTVSYKEDATITILLVTQDTGYYIWGPLSAYEQLLHTPVPPKDSSVALLSWFCSNCEWTPNNRTAYVQELMKYIQIDSYGSCFHNKDIEGYEGSTRRVASHYQLKINAISKYKFVLAFENTNSKDYVTEKIYHAFLAGTIPVYMGAPNAKNFIPFENSYINASEFQSPKHLAEYLQKVAADEELYMSYFKWKQTQTALPESFVKKFRYEHNNEFCRLCAKYLTYLMDQHALL